MSDPEPLEATEAILEVAPSLDFMATDGGPVLFLPLAHKTLWHGVYDEDGEYVFETSPTDYDRACEIGDPIGSIPVGPSEAWVLPCPDSTAFHPLPDGGLLLRWVGADDPESVLTGALLAPDSLWSDTGQVLVSEGAFLLLDAAADGRATDTLTSACALPAGTYAVWSMAEYDGEVRIGGEIHGVMVTAIRLRRQ